ncbi:MAG: hypothetical protein ACLTC4_07185 [Hungatella hathewayi]
MRADDAMQIDYQMNKRELAEMYPGPDRGICQAEGYPDGHSGSGAMDFLARSFN